jgi:hypothetical protein
LRNDVDDSAYSAFQIAQHVFTASERLARVTIFSENSEMANPTSWLPQPQKLRQRGAVPNET